MDRRKALRLIFTALVFALLTLALVDQWDAMRPHLHELSLARGVAAFGILMAALFTSLLSWRALLADLGTHIGIPVAARIFYLGQLAKYVPGSVWAVLASMELGRDHDVPRAHSGSATLIIYPLNVASALCVGAVALPLSSPSGANDYAWALIALPLCAVGLHPRILTRVLNRMARLAKREPLASAPTLAGLGRAGFWAVATNLIAGVHIYVLAEDLGAEGSSVLLVSLGAWAAAWAVGFLLVIFPGGVGPREVALVQLLQPVLPTGAGAVLVVASRLIFALAEVAIALVAAGVLMLLARRARRSC